MTLDRNNNTNMNQYPEPSPETEARITEAFRDLSRRAGAIHVTAGPHATHTPGRAMPGPFTPGNRNLIAGLAFAALAVVAGVSAWQLWPGDDGDSVNVATDGDGDDISDTTDGTDDLDEDGGPSLTDGTDDTTDDTDGTTDDDGTTDTDGSALTPDAGDRLRVDTAAVRADTTDPFLNVRAEPDAGGDLVAKLPPTYRALAATGDRSVTADGATWVEVELLSPVSITAGQVPAANANPTGWVNAAYLVAQNRPIAVDTTEVAACAAPAQDNSLVGGLNRTAYVYGLESAMVGNDCLRVVLTVAPGTTAYDWGDVPSNTGPAAALPQVLVASSGGTGVTVDLGDVASVWPKATETGDDIYIARGEDRRVDLVSPVPVGRVHVTPMPGDGLVVIDLEIAGSPPQADRLVVLLDDPMVGAGTVSVTGLSRPFEASLGVSIVDADGDPVSAVYSGSAWLGTIRGTEYGVMTTDWVDAWGRFAVTASDLEPGDYTMLLDAEGGIESPTATRVPFTITDGPTGESSVPTSGDQATARALVQFAQGGSVDALDEVGLADEVTLALGTDYTETFTRAELADHSNWSLDYEPFAGRVAPFNALDLLADGQVEYSSGPIPHCASPALTWPAAWADLDQINIRPVGVDSCIQWYAVSLFRNSSGEVEAIVLDLYEP